MGEAGRIRSKMEKGGVGEAKRHQTVGTPCGACVSGPTPRVSKPTPRVSETTPQVFRGVRVSVCSAHWCASAETQGAWQNPAEPAAKIVRRGHVSGIFPIVREISI
jgi:hypothetical protein